MSNQIVQCVVLKVTKCVVLKARFCSVFCSLLMVKIRILILRYSGLMILRAKLESLRANLCSVFSYG